MHDRLAELETRRAEVASILENFTAMGVYEGTLNVLRYRIRKLDGDITEEKTHHPPKVDPTKRVVLFHGSVADAHTIANMDGTLTTETGHPVQLRIPDRKDTP